YTRHPNVLDAEARRGQSGVTSNSRTAKPSQVPRIATFSFAAAQAMERVGTRSHLFVIRILRPLPPKRSPTVRSVSRYYRDPLALSILQPPPAGTDFAGPFPGP